jgi:Uma2 family endonuclease
LESDLHRQQIDLLIRLLYWFWRERNDFYASGNLTIYYSPNQLKSEHFRGPDFFVVLGTEKKDRKSWVVWQENGLYPHVIVEILSKATAKTDKQLKKEIYQNTFRTPDYFWFEPVTLELEGFHLLDGQYQPIEPNENNWLWSQQLNLYLGVYEDKLRFFTPEGGLVPLAEEEMSQRAEQERQRAEQAEQEVTRLRELLKAQGNSF